MGIRASKKADITAPPQKDKKLKRKKSKKETATNGESGIEEVGIQEKKDETEIIENGSKPVEENLEVKKAETESAGSNDAPTDIVQDSPDKDAAGVAVISEVLSPSSQVSPVGEESKEKPEQKVESPPAVVTAEIESNKVSEKVIEEVPKSPVETLEPKQGTSVEEIKVVSEGAKDETLSKVGPPVENVKEQVKASPVEELKNENIPKPELPATNESEQASIPPVEKVESPKSEIPSVTEHTVTPVAEVKVEVAEPVESPKAVEEPSKPIEEPPKPVDELPKPVEEPLKPVEEPPKPVEEPPKPVEEPPKPVEEPPKPEEPLKPVEEPAKPVEEPPKPIEEPSKPAEEPPKPVEEPPKPVEEPPKPVEEPPKPAEEPPKPVEEPPKPVEEPPTPAEEPSKPAEESPKPVEEPPKPESPVTNKEDVAKSPVTESAVSDDPKPEPTVANGQEHIEASPVESTPPADLPVANGPDSQEASLVTTNIESPVEGKVETDGKQADATSKPETPLENGQNELLSNGENTPSETNGMNGELEHNQVTEKDQEQNVPTELIWKKGGDQVAISGDFTKWEDQHVLHKVDDVFSTKIKLSKGTHHLKYIVDGVETVDDSQPIIELDGHGQVNVLTVE